MDKKTIILQFLKLLSLPILLFGIAGTFNYWQGWLFFVYILVMAALALYFYRDLLELGDERMHPGKGMKSWDKVIAVVGITLFMALFIISILDSGRYHWTEELPLTFYIITYTVFSVGNYIIFWSMHTCKWFSSVVRIQKDRHQKVVSTGPYAIIRHPGYFGGIIMTLTSPLVLGSLYGMVPALFLLVGIIIRTYLEDNMLQKELAGYKEYTKKTRHRLFKGLW